MRQKRWTWLVALATFALMLTSCGGGATPAASSEPTGGTSEGTGGKTLVIAQDLSKITRFDPERIFEIPAYLTDGNVYDTLVTYKVGDDNHIAPSLAAALPEVSGDGSVYTFRLRPNVKFASGNPLTSADVAFSFNRLENLQDDPAYLADGIQSIETPDDLTVKITLKYPDASFLAALTATNFAVLDSKLVKEHGGQSGPDAAKTDTAEDWLNAHSAGSGPYTLAEYMPKQRIVLKRNPNYWGPPPGVDTVIITHTGESAAQSFAVQRGTVDIAMDLNIHDLKAVQAGQGIRIETGPTFDLVYLGMTADPAKSKPLSDPHVRLAVRHALDYDGIINDLLQGGGYRPASIIPVGLLGNSQAMNDGLQPKTDIALAKKELSDAGYPDGFSATLLYVSQTFDGVPFDALAAKIQSDLAKVGIQVTLQPMQSSAAREKTRNGDLQFYLGTWGADYLDANDFAQVFSPGGPLADRDMHYKNDALKDLVVQADSTTDPDRRTSLYKRIAEIQLEDGPWAVLVQPKLRYAVRSEVANIAVNPVYLIDLSQAQKK